tara:strand:- start:3156 stop:3371 length:216 start_codon:yes stop_codon:yes gene_type:complete
MIKEKEKVSDTIFDVLQVVQNYKKRGISTILLTIPQIEELLDAAGYQTDDLCIQTQKNFDKNKKKLIKKGR